MKVVVLNGYVKYWVDIVGDFALAFQSAVDYEFDGQCPLCRFNNGHGTDCPMILEARKKGCKTNIPQNSRFYRIGGKPIDEPIMTIWGAVES